MEFHPRFPTSPTARVVAAAVALTALSACSTMGSESAGLGESIGFRDARFAEFAATRDYRECRAEALALDSQARQQGSSAQYLASARVIEKCEAGLGAETTGIEEEERMRAYGLSIQNYLKGGDIVAARANLERFKATFPGRDLYYPDGTSFTETMELLLGLRDSTANGRFSLANVGGTLKGELRRAEYWKHR